MQSLDDLYETVSIVDPIFLQFLLETLNDVDIISLNRLEVRSFEMRPCARPRRTRATKLIELAFFQKISWAAFDSMRVATLFSSQYEVLCVITTCSALRS